jgi:opacity protein-like surface antigen
MARKHFGIVVLLTVAILAGNAVAQKSNEVAGTIGRTFIANQAIAGNTVHFGDALTYEANYAHRFLNFGVFGVSVEVPFVIDPKTRLQYHVNVVPYDFKSYFVTPAARVNLFPTTAFSPWVSVGGGVGIFTPSSTLEFSQTPNPGKSRTTGVFEVGGGLDVRVLGNFKIRGEIRDFYSGEPPINLNPSRRYNNLYAAAGVVFSF